VPLAAALWLAGCAQDVRLVAVRGCGIDPGPDRLRVTVRGDFPANPVFVEDGDRLPALPDEARFLSVEGLSGEDPVAVGNSGPLERTGDAIPVYYARPDGLCAVPSGVLPRTGGTTVSTGRVAAYAGGRDAEGSMLADVVVAFADEARAAVVASLPIPTVAGFSVPDGADAAWFGGGVGPSGVVASAVRVDLSDGDVSDPVPLWDGDRVLRIAHAGVAPVGGGRVAVVGGCSEVLDDICDPKALHGTTRFFRAQAQGLVWSVGPRLPEGRADPLVAVFEDGTLLVAGGMGPDGAPRRDLFVAPAGDFVPFGPALEGGLAPDETLVGLAAQAPASAVVVTDAGRFLWVGRDFVEPVTVADEFLSTPRSARRPVTLPGERVLVGDVIVPFSIVGADLAVDQGVGDDPRFVVYPTLRTPGPRRFDTDPVLLDDGTVVLFGGFDENTEALGSGAFVRRLRPSLDGPFEAATALGDLAGRIVAHGPGVLLEPGGRLRLPAVASGSDRLSRGIHVRGIRGANLRLEVRVASLPLDGIRFVHAQSLWTGVEIRVGPGGAQARRVGNGPVPTCGSGAAIEVGETVRFEVLDASYRIRVGDAVRYECTVEEPFEGFVGVGGAEDGEVVLEAIKVARLRP